MKTAMIRFISVFLVFSILSSFVLADEHEEDDDLEVFGLEVEKLLSFGSGLLAAVLFAFTFVAYQRTKRRRLKFVAAAFLLFSIKTLLISTELFIDELPLVDPVSAFLDFGILLSFFIGVVKK